MRLNRILSAISLLAILIQPVLSDDLYRVTLSAPADASLLNDLAATPILSLQDGYLILLDSHHEAAVKASGISITHIAADVTLYELAIGNAKALSPKDAESAVFRDNDLVLFRADVAALTGRATQDGLRPLLRTPESLIYTPPEILSSDYAAIDIPFDSLMELVSQDSIETYLYRLEAFYRRLTGTDSCYAARDWIAAKFLQFGYDSVYIDNFTGSQLWDRVPVSSDNVVATKVGTKYPDKHIIVGGHFDAVPDCPGADDNGTGTTGTLEIARILAGFETEKTIIFIAFDSEESWLWGSYHYADEAAARGDDIEYMMNLDMIGHYTNDDEADLYNGANAAYSQLWQQLGAQYGGIIAYLSGSTASDHYPFQELGIPVTFVQERIFSNHYHQPSDSTTYVNFEYMTRMIGVSLLTIVSVDAALPPVVMTSAQDVGDGQSLKLHWLPLDPADFDFYRLYYYPAGEEEIIDSVTVASTDSSTIISGLTTLQPYSFYMKAFDNQSGSSISHNTITGTPRLIPAAPQNIHAWPQAGAVYLSWNGNNTELDFSHYQIYRDGVALPSHITAFNYTDADPSLGSDLHYYHVVAVDEDNNSSDTIGISPAVGKAASLARGRILAINATNYRSLYLGNPLLTAAFLEQALNVFQYDMVTDTMFTITHGLLDFIDYELIVIGAESGRYDQLNTMLADLDVYLAIGGKVIVFGRWGDIGLPTYPEFKIIDFDPGTPQFVYTTRFDIDYRTQVISYIETTAIHSDLIGADNTSNDYPGLVWDSMAAINHTRIWTEIGGIPCSSFPTFTQPEPQIIYTYNSREDRPETEGQPIAWESDDPGQEFVFFECPLSFMDAPAARLALRIAAVHRLSSGCSATATISDSALVMQSLPETICLYISNCLNGRSVNEIDLGTILINNSLAPDSASIVSMEESKAIDALALYVSATDLLSAYDLLPGEHKYPIAAAWEYTNSDSLETAYGMITVSGSENATGDANGDGALNISDAVFLLNYIFRGGIAPEPPEIGDADCSGGINISDVVYLVNFIFRNGPAPECDR